MQVLEESFMQSERNKNIEIVFFRCRCGNLDEVRDWIENKNFEVDSFDKIGCTALHMASQGGNNELVRYFLSKGANIDKKTQHDNPEISAATPLIYAVMHGNVNVAKTLIQHGASLDVMLIGNNLLDIAIHSDNPEMIGVILSIGYTVEQLGVMNMTPLSLAFSKDKYQSAKFLLENGADYKRFHSDNGTSPLFYAVQEEGETDRCTALLLRHFEKMEGREDFLKYINYSCNGHDTHLTALHAACLRQNYRVVKALLECGADPNVKDKEGFLPRDLLNYLGNHTHARDIGLLLEGKQIEEYSK